YDGEIHDSGLWDHAEGIGDAMVIELEPGKPEAIFAMRGVHRHQYSWPLVRWDGQTDRPLANAGPEGPVRALEVGRGPWQDSLFIGGRFAAADGKPASSIARLDASGFHGITG